MQRHPGDWLTSLLISLMLLVGATAQAASGIEQILALDEAPEGVVFEIAEDDDDDLGWAIPKTVKQIKRLRQRFPGLPVAVVTHGVEMFALKTEHREAFRPVHDAVQSLTQQQDVDLHVCGTHASWYNADESDFPDYVDVAPVGPVQIRQYQELGYILIRIER
ncbi:DsrE family protein [endosymbiont of Riftia pachyptila]|uniref:Uncharacterized protein n=1 Tax=endosymbiont of Riftia pachyptila (vent Ph05) TaxID=1048808 RepID=G2DDG4_9GAMM|nr:DsrE family protein [endosymbiont of Riftia pachyptila]EGV51365.1 hypothetical protein Rifp1Sym_bm00260 [endosymbiont of Riftia pachyptila (vent Ph05)]